MDNKQKFNVIFAIFAAFGILIFHEIWSQQQTITAVPYSELENLLRQGKVAELSIRERYISGTLKEPENGKRIIVANRVEPGLARPGGPSTRPSPP